MIRPLEEKDIPEILDIYNWYIENTVITFEEEKLSLDEFSDRVHGIIKNYPFIVLEEDNKVVGYAYLDVFNPRVAYRYTADVSIYLDHETRGKGYGSMLMEEIISIAKEKGYVNLMSLITEGNTASEKIHEKFGFKREALCPQLGYKFNTWLGVSYYQLQLKKVK